MSHERPRLYWLRAKHSSATAFANDSGECSPMNQRGNRGGLFIYKSVTIPPGVVLALRFEIMDDDGAGSSSSSDEASSSCPKRVPFDWYAMPPPSGVTLVDELVSRNDDLIAAIEENAKLGRLDHCLAYQRLVKSNLLKLMSLVELVKRQGGIQQSSLWPAARVSTPLNEYWNPNDFPSAFNPLDILQDVPCEACKTSKRSGKSCRRDCKHVAPNWNAPRTFGSGQRMLTDQVSSRLNQPDEGNPPAKNSRRRWTDQEHQICLEVAAEFGPRAYKQMAMRLGGTRTAEQIRSHMNKCAKRQPTSSVLLSQQEVQSTPPLNKAQEEGEYL